MFECFTLCSTHFQIHRTLQTYLRWWEDTDHFFKMADAGLERNIMQSKEEGGDLHQREGIAWVKIDWGVWVVHEKVCFLVESVSEERWENDRRELLSWLY